MAADLSHIETPAKVSGFIGAEQLGDAVADCDIVVIPAGRTSIAHLVQIINMLITVKYYFYN